MSNDTQKKIYSNLHNRFFDKIINKKRFEIIEIINNFIKNKDLLDVLDVGTTNDDANESSNIIIKNLIGIKIFKSISDQLIDLKLFSKTLKKSITDDFTEEEIKDFQSDLVISNATIEHVGNLENQLKMCENIINLSRKYFIIMTPNRFHPLEFHTKIPIIHWLPKGIHRKILRLVGLKFLAEEKNLNLLSQHDLELIMRKLNQNNYEIKSINFFFIKSNLILIGEKN